MKFVSMKTAAALVSTLYVSRRPLPRTRSDGLLCLSGSYSRLLQGQKLHRAMVAHRGRGLPVESAMAIDSSADSDALATNLFRCCLDPDADVGSSIVRNPIIGRVQRCEG